MIPHRRYIVLALLVLLLRPMAAWTQSDSQTLRSPFASLVGIAEFDFGLPAGSRIGYPLSLGGNLIGGFQMNRLFTLGVGVGLHGYGPGDMVLLPVFADARLHLPQKKWTPFIAVDMGWAFSLDTLQKGGFLLNPSVGGRFPMTDNSAIGFSLGMRVQKNQAKLDDVFQDYLSNYFSMKLSLVMKLPRLSRRVFKQTMHRMKDKTKREN